MNTFEDRLDVVRGRIEDALDLLEQPKKQTEPGERMENLRIPVPVPVWDELTRVAHQRRVTVRYLCLEALAEKGYNSIDMSTVPKDGRRIKKNR